MRFQKMAVFLAVALSLGAALPAHAQRLIAVTQALTATREAAALYTHSLDFSGGGVLPGASRLMGGQLDTLLLWPGGAAGVVITSDLANADDRLTWWRTLRTAPFAPDLSAMPETIIDTSHRLLKLWEMPGGGRWIARAGADVASQCAISAQPWNLGRLGTAAMTRPIQGTFLLGDALPGAQGEVVVLVERSPGNFLVCFESIHGGAPGGREVVVPLPAHALDVRPRALLATDTGVVMVLLGGYDLGSGDAVPASWVVALRASGPLPEAPLRLLGSPQEATGVMIRVPGGQCWAITREPGRDTVYATLLQVGTGGPEKVEQYPLAGVRGVAQLAVREGPTPDIAAILGERIELWPAGKRGTLVRRFDAPTGAVTWTPQGPVVSVGGEVHLLDPGTLNTQASLQLQSGEVIALAAVPPAALPPDDPDGDGLSEGTERAMGADPLNPDSDADGLHDGTDPEPARPTNVVQLPRSITFHGDAAGQELHAFQVAPQPDPDARWQVLHDAEALPALRLYPATSYGTRPAYLGLDPQFFLRPERRLGVLRAAALRPLQSRVDPPESESLVRIASPEAGPTRVLWILGAAENTWAERLQGALARPPLCLAHVRTADTVAGMLSNYATIVLGTAAAARGAIAQSDLVRYVAGGGAVLVVPEPSAPGERDVREWFAGLGLRLVPDQPIAPPFTWVDALGPARLFPANPSECSTTLKAQPGDLPIRATGADAAGDLAGPLFLRPFGAGRVAAVADAHLLDPDNPESARFALALFRWLGRAKLDLRDFDNDGLPDALEDSNGNQATDPGETDRFIPDTDGDGLDDGQEDRNRNGLVDDGETDPRNRDSDGDGVYDGADPQPCPVLGVPRILAATPSSAPAEGGVRITISGQNLDHALICQFGDVTAHVVRADNPQSMEVIAPPFAKADGGDVDLALSRADGSDRTVLPGGFRYTRQSVLPLRIGNAAPGRKHGKIFNGILAVSLDVPIATPLTRLILVLEATPGEQFHFGVPRPGAALQAGAFTLEPRAKAANQLMLTLAAPVAAPMPGGDLVLIPWEYRAEEPPALNLAVGMQRQGDADGPIGVALGAEGGAVEVTCAPFPLDVNAAVRRVATP